ncbi:DMT family transporter [Paenibacillus validus]|uniref:EamA family transporter n=1 Tax=Paenibacillus validus TaxID=44253 RepID=A0A7X2Z8Q5_9BACL|nr:DMT family transporter [Paenibacillus validus]MUG69728.1 EamA family transporter [Paenibacillus validus]
MKPSKSFPFPISLLLIIGIVAISFSSIFIRWSNSPVSVSAMYRLTITALLMLPLLFPYRASVRRMRLREWLELFASGLALGLHFLLWMGSLRLTSVASSTAITSLEPVFVLLGAWLLYRQKTSWPAILSMGLAMLGALMIGWGDWGLTGSALLGDALSLLGTAAVAAHMLLGKRLLAHMPPFVYSFFVFVFAAVCIAGYNLALGIPLTGYPAREWGLFLLLALVPTVFGHYVFNWLLTYMRPETVSMSVLGEPVGATLLAYFLLGEEIGPRQAAAGLLLLLGVWLFIRTHEKEQPSIQPPLSVSNANTDRSMN